jgi:hypothetical protein
MPASKQHRPVDVRQKAATVAQIGFGMMRRSNIDRERRVSRVV